jgi:autotransporter-associated beta strand protein
MRNGPAGSGGTDANGQPRPDFQDGVTWGDEMLFDGVTTGPVIATQDGGFQANGGGSGQPYGLHIHLTANQIAPVTLYTRAIGASGGMRMNSIQIDAGAGQLSLGSNSLTGVLDILAGVLNGQVLGFTNNSSTPCVINPDVRWRLGGAGSHPHVFAGSGDFNISNHLRSANQSSIQVQKFGPGTMTWIGTNVGSQSGNWGDSIGSPIIIGEGTMIWKTADLVSFGSSGNPNINNNATWIYDVVPTVGLVTGPGQVLGSINGNGSLEIRNGTLTFGSANSTYSGTIILTGGELIAGAPETVSVSGPLGQNGIISFNGGTLGWSLANAFDYSSRFNTANNQVYNLDTGGSSPTLTTGLTSIGGSLNKLGGGTLTLAGANTYTGPTTIAASGGLVFQGTKSGNATITVADTATLGVFENGSQITPSTLKLGSSTGATLEFNNVTNHTVATLAPNTLSAAGTVTINVNSGRFVLIGETFPLLKWTSGTAPATALAFLAGAGGHLTTNGNEIDVVIDNPPFIWTGAINGIWDTATTNWVRNALSTNWANGGYSLLDDSSTVTNLALTGTITPTNATINNSSSNPYAITNSPGNVIGGPGSLTKNGNGTLLLPGGANTYSGVTTLGGGILQVDVLANGGSASDIGAASSAAGNIVLSGGGTLLYTGPGASIDHLFTVGPGGGVIDNEGAGLLSFTNKGSLGMSGNGPRTLTLTGPNSGDTLACNIPNHPAGTSLTKNGPGLWILTGTNTYNGGTTLLQGGLQIGTGGPSGTIGNNNISTAAGTTIDFQHGGTNPLLVPGSINGAAAVSVSSIGTVVLANNNGYTGGTTINAGTLQVGNGGSSGSLYIVGAIANYGTLVFNTSGSFAYSGAGLISGSGNVVVQGGGLIKATGNNTYTGWTRIDTNSTFQPREGQDGFLVSSVVTNNGTLRFVSQDATFIYGGPIVGSGKVQIGANAFAVGVITLTGTNTYTGGTFIGGNTLVLGDGSTPGAGALAGNVIFTNNFPASQDIARTITFNRPDDFTFSGTITTNFSTPQNYLGIVQQNGAGKLTLTGTNNYGGRTVINSGTIQVGNGGSTGAIGFGPVTDNSALIFNRAGSLTVSGAISGGGSLTLIGPGTVALTAANNTLLGPTTVSNGTLVVSSLGGGALNVEGGTVIVGGTGSIGNVNVGNMNIDSGTVVASLNRASSPSNTTYTVLGALNHTGGTLKLVNAGPTLQIGDKFRIFNQPIPGGATMPIISPGCTVSNSLASDGSVVVTTAQPLPSITPAVSGSQLTLSWPAAWTGGVVLQSQTNKLTTGLNTNWVTIPGTDATNVYVTTIAKTNGTVFFRLTLP